jgi:CRP-like cAMP-binding protein
VSAELDTFALLHELSKEERASLMQFLNERRFDAGDQLFDVHDESEEMLLLVEGRVRLQSSGANEGFLEAGQVLGAASLVLVGNRMCAAFADGPVRVLALARESYLRLRSDYPRLALCLQEAIVHHFASDVRSLLG